MGRKFILGTAMAITTTALTACLPGASVYGPPPDDPGAETYQTSPEAYETVTFKPEDEINEDVYGPPEWFDPDYEEEADTP